MSGILKFSVGVFGVLAVAAFGLIMFANSEKGKTWLVEKGSDALGREVQVGALAIDWSLSPRISAIDVLVANIDDGQAPVFAEIGAFSIKLEALPLLWGETIIYDLKTDNTQLNFERLASGEANWDFGFGAAGMAEEIIVPDDREEFPVVRQLSVTNTKIQYTDRQSGAAFAFDMDAIEAEVPRNADIRLHGNGAVRDVPASLALHGGSVEALWTNDAAFPLDVQVQVGKTQFTADGTLNKPLALRGGSLAFELSGETLSDIFILFNIPLPPSAPYTVSGQLDFDGGVWTASSLDGQVGESDIGGRVTVDLARQQPFIEMDLTSQQLVLSDLGGFIGLEPETIARLSAERLEENDPPEKGAPEDGTTQESTQDDGTEVGQTSDGEKSDAAEETSQPAKVLPDMPVNLTRLRSANMQASIRTDTLVFPPYPTRSLDMTVNLQDGIARISPFKLGFAEGAISGEINLYGDDDIPTLHTGLTFNQIGISDFFVESDFVEEMSGALNGYFRIIGTGRSLAEILGVADGEVALELTNGTISGFLVEAIELDIIETLAVWLGDDPALEVKCAFVGFDVNDGLMQSRIFDITTDTSHIFGEGTVNLANEELDLKIEAEATDFSLLDSDAPISISGPMSDPRIGVGIGVLLPFIEFGGSEKDLCGELRQTAESAFPVYRSFKN